MRPLNPSPSPPPSSSSLASDETRLLNDEIFEQLHSCIKLANENKINHKNAWGLKLIDHLMEIVKAEADGGAETNFRTASCSLEAGVKIYSVRVDALYSEAYNVLGGISVASLGSQEDIATSESHNAGSEEGKDNVEEKLEKKTASGLINILLFAALILSFSVFSTDSIEQMVINLPRKMEISPTLREIVSLLNESRQMPFERSNLTDKFCNMDDDIVHDEEVQSDNHSFENSETTFQENDYYDASFESDVSTSYERVAMFLFRSLDITGKQNSWAGPDYWKFLKPKVQKPVQTANDGFACSSSRRRKRSVDCNDIDFTKSLDFEADIFAPPANPLSLLLPADRVQSGHSLPEDCHYQPMDLAKLFLRPDLLFLGRRSATLSDSTSEFHDPDEASPSSDCVNPCDLSGQHGDNYFHEAIGAEEPFYQNGQVNKMEGRHGKASKPVDLRALKQTLWEHLQEQSGSFPATTSNEWSGPISFKQLLATCPLGSPQNDISPQLCFICLLHLGNEVGLKIQGCPTLDEVILHLPLRPPSSDAGQ
ncbi:unnamed protein product [Linum tenue]|uniref:Condensin complex subunit 2 n=1 Tax=Linum tenue TaxID=586396 RepID=A0AAV0H2A2_9ROSI|nr:unnamed protein product [Linum tenue]